MNKTLERCTYRKRTVNNTPPSENIPKTRLQYWLSSEQEIWLSLLALDRAPSAGKQRDLQRMFMGKSSAVFVIALLAACVLLSEIGLQPDRRQPRSNKHTLGSWDFVEKGADCEEIANRQYGKNGMMEINDANKNWRNVAPCGD